MKKTLLTVSVALALSFSVQASTYHALTQGAKLGDVAEIRTLLGRGASADTTDIEGNTLLMLAARDGHGDLVQLLINHRAKLNARNAAGDTALALAALRGHLRVVQLLTDAGASQSVPGWPPLVYGAFGGHRQIVTWLLGKGANIDAASDNGMTALMAAARGGHIDIVKDLLKAGADTTKKTDAGQTARDIALGNNNTDIASLLGSR